jgi:hypothetical protein
LRFREPGLTVVDAAMAVALLDALPPALLSALPAVRPAASVEWHVQFFAELPRPLAVRKLTRHLELFFMSKVDV